MTRLRSLRFRLLLVMALAVAVAIGAVAVLSSRAVGRQFGRYLQDYGAPTAPGAAEDVEDAVAGLLGDHYRRQGWRGAGALVETLAGLTGGRLVLTDAAGRVVADSQGAALGRTIDLAASSRDVALEVDDRPVGAFVLYGAPEEASRLAEMAFLTSVNRALAVAALAAGAAAVLLTWGVARHILRPIDLLIAATGRLAQGDLRHRVEVRSGDELEQLAEAFNAMGRTLARTEALRRDLVSDVAHELRTPLANVRGYLEALQDGVMAPTPETLASLHEEAMLLSRLIDDLQELAQAEAGRLELMRQPVDLAEVVATALVALQPRIAGRELRLRVEVPDGLPRVDCDPERVGQVLRNLLQNAVTHTPAGGSLAVVACLEGALTEGALAEGALAEGALAEGALAEGAPSGGGQVRVTVADSGRGIPAEHLPFVFERFYRVDRSRSRATGGTGLGLAIVRQLVQAHGGRVWAKSTPGEGTEVSFTLPRAAMHSAPPPPTTR